MTSDRLLPREMAERAKRADRVVVLPSGVVRLETGKFAEVYVPYEWTRSSQERGRP
jgi:hypothetical protein